MVAGQFNRGGKRPAPPAGKKRGKGMTLHIVGPARGFGPGFTAVIEPEHRETGIAFGVMRLAAGEKVTETVGRETAWLLMEGRARLTAGGREARLSRRSLFDESASCLHVAAGEPVEIDAETDCEFTVYGTHNRQRFDSRFY